MRIAKLSLSIGALLLLTILLTWWVASAGLTTVQRTLRYNFSGIDDVRIFPGRTLTAAPEPFRFREAITPELAALMAHTGGEGRLGLGALLRDSLTTAFVMIKDDTIVFEYYSGGYDRGTPSLSFSMAKSILSILVGCAIDDGILKSIDQPVTDYVPELARRGFGSVTLRHLLQMTSGINYAENDNPFGLHVRFYYTDHLEDEILKLTLQEPPGRRFLYKSSDAFLLTLALQRALHGRNVTDYMQQRLWHPLGMEHEGVWSVDHEPGGLEKTACCLTATARDFAKFGRLYVDRGQWNGRRIVSENWVRASTRPETGAGDRPNYQHLWWLITQDRDDFLAAGHLGQFLYVSPADRVVIVRLGKSRGGLSRAEWAEAFRSLSQQLR